MTEDPLLFYGDVLRIVRVKWKKALIIALGLGSLFISREGERPVTYLSEASFKEVEPASDGGGGLSSLKNLFISGGSSGGGLRGVMTSRELLTKVVCEAGVQVSPVREKLWWLSNIKKKCLLDLKKEIPLAEELLFSKVDYKGKKALPFSIVCVSQDSFLYKRGDLEVPGTFLTPFTDGEVTFTIDPKEVKDSLGKTYHFVLNPLSGCVDGLMKGIEIYASKIDSSIIELEYRHPNPVQGNRILEAAMATYQKYLIEERARHMNGQLSHLDQRFSYLGEKFQQDLDQFSHFLKQNKMLSTTSEAQDLTEKLHKLEEDLRKDMNHRNFLLSADFSVNALASPALASLTTQLNDLLSRRMTIDINSLEDEKESVLGRIFNNFAAFQSPPSTLQQRESLIKKIDKANGLIDLGSIEEKKYMKNLVAISSELLLERRLYHLESKDYSGLDLSNVYAIYHKHCAHRDECLAKVKNMQRLIQQIEPSKFEMLVCSGALVGYSAEGFLDEASRLFALRRDRANHSEKELERIERECHRVYDLILQNLREVSARWNSELEYSKNHMRELSLAITDILNKQILLLKCQINTQKQALIDEINERIHRNQELQQLIKEHRQHLPDLLMEEKKLMMKSEMTKSMIQGLSQLIEGKMVAKTLSSIESRPFNQPYSTMQPINPHMLIKTIGLICVIFAGAVFIFVVIRIFQGLPVSLERLTYQGFRVAGYLKDTEVLRKMTQGASGVVGLFGQSGPDYSHDMAKLLVAEGKKVLLIETHFNAMIKQGAQRGLFHYLNGSSESVPLISYDGYDYIPMVGRSLFGTELLRSQRFKDLVAMYRKQYDVVLLYSSAKLESGEAEGLLQVCDTASLTLQEETEVILKPYQVWNLEKKRIIFVQALSTF